jgi:cytoskeletal protein RodZ
MLNKLGEELKEARLKTDATLQQMSLKTRIDIKFLEALESGNYSFLPDLYVKAFLKEYCAFVGLDTAVILKKYDLAKQGKSFDETSPQQPATVAPPEIKPEIKKEEPKPVHIAAPPVTTFDAVPHNSVNDINSPSSGRQKILLAAIVGGTVIVIAAVYFLFFNNRSDIIVPEKPFEEVVQQQDKYYEDQHNTPAATDTAAAAPVSADSMKLDIRATDTTWVKILLDDKRSEEFILFPRSRKTITAASNYKITFGKSYAIRLELNGKPLEYKPGKTKVAHVMVDSTGVTSLEEPPRF